MSYLKGLADRISYKEDPNVREIDINLLMPSKDNFYGIRDIEELAQSIKESTLLHNLVVRKNEDKYEILSGERRYRALMLLGVQKVPCKIVDLENIDAQILLIQANSNQRELTASEKMQQINKLQELYAAKKQNGEKLPEGKKTRDLIGSDLGMSGSQVAKYQAVSNNLTPGLINKLEENKISFKQAQDLSKLTQVEQYLIHNKITDESTKDDIDNLIEEYSQDLKPKSEKNLKEEYKEVITPIVVDDETEADIVTENISSCIEEVSGQAGIKEYPPQVTDLRKLLEYDSQPKLVICSNGIDAILYTAKITINPQDNTNTGHKLSIKLAGIGRDNIITVPLSLCYKVDKLPNGCTPQNAYKIHEGLYFWFKRKAGDE